MKRYLLLFLLLAAATFAVGQDYKKLMELGHVGSGVVQTNTPRLMAVDNALARLFVVDQGHHRVLVLNPSTGALIMTVGSYGTGTGQFRDPYGVAVASDGSFYVSDQSNNRVQKFTSNGTFELSWAVSSFPRGIAVNQSNGDVYVVDASNHRIHRYSSTGTNQLIIGSSGSGDGQFSGPVAIAIASNNDILVVDQNNNRIQRFNSSGTFLSKFATFGSADGQLSFPTGIAINSTNQILISDANNARVQVFDDAGTFVSKFGTSGSTDGLFGSLKGIAVDASGNIFVTDDNPERIQKFTSAGAFVWAVGKASDNGLFNTPIDLAHDSNGNLFVVDQNNHRIQKFSSSGAFVLSFGSSGSGDGQLFFPTGIGIDDANNIYVADQSNARIQKFDNNGNFLMKFGSSGTGDGQFLNVYDVDADASGNIYVVDQSNHRIQKFSSTGVFILKWGTNGSGDGQFSFPRNITVDANGDILVSDASNARIQKFNNTGTTMILKFGTSGTGAANFILPSGIAVDTDGNIWIADFSNNRIKKVNSAGTTQSLFGSVGTTGTADLELFTPNGVSVYNGVIAVCDRYDRVKFIYPLATEPTSQSTGLAFSNVESSSFTATIAAAAGNPEGYLVVRKTGSSPTGLPEDVQTYSFSSAVGDGFVVYSGPAGSFNLSGLSSGTTYYFDVFAFNGSGIYRNYRTSFPLETSVTTTTSPFSILKDINDVWAESSGVIGTTTEFNGQVVFPGTDGSTGTELWKSDGTANGTVLVKDLNSGSSSGGGTRMGVINSKLIFLGNDGSTGVELYSSDGTANGTVLVKDIYPGPNSGLVSATSVVRNGIIYFAANDGVHGSELWRTDGTTNGTYMVKDIVTGTGSAFPSTQLSGIAMTNTILFYANTPDNGFELWKSDGTESGTSLVKDIYPGTNSSSTVGQFMNATSTLVFFVADDGSGSEMWKTDGTLAGTAMVKDLNLTPGASRVISDELYFLVSSSGLWKTDGTDAGTVLIRGSIFPQGSMIDHNGILYFAAQSGSFGTELWKSDLTTAGTVMVKDINTGSLSGVSNPVFVVFNNAVYFVGQTTATGSELYKTDGTSAGTVMIADLFPGTSSSFPAGMVVANNELFFSAATSVGRELYKTDGATITLVKNVNTNYSNGAGIVNGGSRPMTLNGNLLFFGQSSTGSHLWRTDATEAGTYSLVPDTNPYTSLTSTYRTIGNISYFSAFDATAGSELWKTDGTPNGTTRIKDIFAGTGNGVSSSGTASHAELNGIFYFIANDGSTGLELWKTDGTDAGTSRVLDLWAGATSSSPNLLEKVNNLLFFLANDGTNGIQLWKTDGTQANTERITNEPGGFLAAGTSASQSTVIGNLYFFVVSDVAGTSLWRSDGTAAGTYKLVTLSVINSIVPLGNKVIITKTSGIQVWATDGSVSGTVKLADFATIFTSAYAELYSILNGYLYFSAATSGEGTELWRTDGTVEGTTLFKDFLPGPAGGSLSYPVAVGDRIYFHATTQPGKISLWESDGTTCGTHQLSNDQTGGGTFHYRIGQKLIFMNFDATNSNEYFTFDLSQVVTPTPTVVNTHPLSQAVCVGNQVNFSVAAGGTNLTYQWKKAGSAIPGATSSSYNINPVSAGDVASYTVDVTGVCGTVTSNAANVTINALTVIDTHPTAQDVCTGAALNLSATATGTGLTYQWKKDNTNISGATSSTYSVASAAAANAGSYTVEVTGTCGISMSNAAAVTVKGLASISGHPSTQNLCVAQSLALSVTGSNLTTYQWYKNNVAITGATAATFNIASPVAADAATYKVTVGNTCNTITSNDAVITIAPVPAITQQPTRVFQDIGGNFTLSVTATNAQTYQWYKDDVALAGATTTSYARTGATVSDAGDYKVIVSQSCTGGSNTVTSNVVKVNIFETTKDNYNVSFNTFGSSRGDYRIVSVPLTLDNATVANVFEDDLGPYDKSKWRLFRFANGTTTELTSTSTITIGSGYWLIVKDSKTIDAGPGQIPLSDPHTINLMSGWNQIGNPFATDVAWADILAANPTLPSTTLLNVFNGGWSSGTSLKAFGGGFVNVSSSFELKIPRGNFVDQGRRHEFNTNAAINEDFWQVNLKLKQGEVYSDIGGVGMAPDATDSGFDGFDQYNPPRFLEYLEIAHPISFQGTQGAMSMVPTRSRNIWEFNVTSNLGKEIVELRWDNTYFGANDREIFLVDRENEIVINMRTTSEYLFSMKPNHRFKVVYGDEDFVRENSTPETETLVVHPNPFSGTLNVQFTLTDDSFVALDMLDNHSRVVKPVMSKLQQKGTHTLSLGTETTSLSSGIYIMRLKINDRIQYKKVIKQ